MTTIGDRTAVTAIQASVVVATFNRRAAAERLLGQLAAQTLDPSRFEVVVVDDGSAEPVTEWLPRLTLPYRVSALRQANAGAAAARHRGVVEARGELIVITDDDMQLAPGFLAAHLSCHGAGTRRVVIGRIRSSTRLSDMPVFERFHARLLDRWAERPLQGDMLYTGNMSLRRADYLAVGGFDSSLELAEDADLGLRLEQAGVEIAFSENAFTVHESDRADFGAWRRRAAGYGRCWLRMARKYPTTERADPWAIFFRNSRAKRPFVALMVVSPTIGGVVAWLAHAATLLADRLGLERLALVLTSLLFDLEFFRGVRQEAGGLRASARSLAGYLGKAGASRAADSPPNSSTPSPTVARSAMHLLVAQVTTTALSIGLAAVLARYLGAADFGLFFLVTSMAGLTNVFVEWGQSQYLIREVAQRREGAGGLLGTSLALRTVFGLTACGAVVATARALGYDDRTSGLAALMVAATLPALLMQTYAAVFRAHERTDLEAVVTVVAKAATLAVTFAALHSGGRLPAAVLAQGAGGVVALLLALLLARRLTLPRAVVSTPSARALLVGGTPFASMSLTIGAQTFLDALVLSKLAPGIVVGWYGAARNVMNTLITPAAILGAASLPRLARESASPGGLLREVRSALRMVLGLASLASVGTFLFADVAVALIYGIEHYQPAVTLLRVFALLLPLLFVDVLLGTAASVTRPGRLAASKLAAIAVATALAIVAVPLCQARFGNGAIGLLLGFAAGEVVMIVAALRLLPRRVLDRVFWLDVGRAAAAGVGTALLIGGVPGLPPLVAIPACVVVFAALSTLLGLSRREDLGFIHAILGAR